MSQLRAVPLVALLGLSSFAALVVACEDPAKDKPQATVAPPVEAPKVAPASKPTTDSAGASATTAIYGISPDTSKVEWEGSKVTGKHVGSFGAFSGSVEVADNSIENAKITIEIDTNSLRSEPEALLTHLKSADFFDVAKFPKATFESTSIAKGGAGGATHTITGNLDLHGQKRSITIPATISTENGRVKAKSEFVLKRKDFGIVYPGKPNDLIRDDVLIRLTIDAPKK